LAVLDLHCTDLVRDPRFYQDTNSFPFYSLSFSNGESKVYYLIKYDPSIHVISGHNRL